MVILSDTFLRRPGLDCLKKKGRKQMTKRKRQVEKDNNSFPTLKKQKKQDVLQDGTKKPMKTKKLVKKALKNPSYWTEGDLAFFKRWLDSKKKVKPAKIKTSKTDK